MQIAVIGLDLAKNVFQVHGIDDAGQAVLKRKLRRSEVLPFFAGLDAALVGIEACHTAHYWGREIAALGHDVRLMPPQFVKPYVRHRHINGKGVQVEGQRAALCGQGILTVRLSPSSLSAREAIRKADAGTHVPFRRGASAWSKSAVMAGRRRNTVRLYRQVNRLREELGKAKPFTGWTVGAG